MTIKIPKPKPVSFPLMGKTFTIDHVKRVDDAESYGETIGAHREIRMKDTLDGDDFEDTLLHETVHGIMYLSGLTELFTAGQEEALVLAIENGLSPLYCRRTKKYS